MALYTPVILKGDYSSNAPERQEMAKLEGCICVVSFHFNSAGPTATGGEVYYQSGSNASKSFAEVMWTQMATIGLTPHGTNAVRAATPGTDPAFINYYEMTAILLETLYISNPNQAALLHGPGANAFLNKLADAIATTIKGQFLSGGKIGLDSGHVYKTSSPNDTGSACALGDNERTHVVDLVERVRQRL